MESTRMPYLSGVEKIAALLLLVYPTLMLVIRGGMNGVFILMLLLALAVWMVKPSGLVKVQWRREWTIYSASMLALTVAILLSQGFSKNFSAHPHDAASRYWLAIPLLMLLQRLHLKVFKVLQLAFPLGAIAGILLAENMGYGLTIRTLDKIHFGDYELMLGVLSLFSIDWFGHDKLPLRILKIIGFIAGLVASIESGTRGGWISIPVFVAIFFYFRTTWLSSNRIVFIAIGGVLIATLLNSPFSKRVNDLANDVTTFDQGNRDTSTGVRWQLYRAAVDVFVHHPIFGVGPEGFALEMQPMLEKGEITPLAAELGRGEVHNDILSKTAGMGIFGLMAILAVYFVPFGLFWKATKSASGQIRRSGILGITFVSGIFVFGLTVEFLNLTLATAFYSFTVAVLLAACYNIHHEEQTHASLSK